MSEPVVAAFDFISHKNMHLPFNEGYVRVLRAAFPKQRIVFHAGAGHIDHLRPRLTDIHNVEFRPCDPFTVPFGFSRHNPLFGRLGARETREAMRKALAGLDCSLVSLMGFDANLLAVVGRGWPGVSSAPLHMILHGQLGDTVIWRSRNPLVRAGDLVAQLNRPLPPSVRVVALELGVQESIATLSRPFASSTITLEHPVLESEWAPAEACSSDVIKVAFLGHARRTKGFDVFVDIATRCATRTLEFHSIGPASSDTYHLPMEALAGKPSEKPISRAAYLSELSGVDLVCLPLQSAAYNFTASGTLMDAIAGLKPVAAVRNATLDAMTARYGAFGYVADSSDALFALLSGLDRADFLSRRGKWIETLDTIRRSRRPQALGPTYAATTAKAEATL